MRIFNKCILACLVISFNCIANQAVDYEFKIRTNVTSDKFAYAITNVFFSMDMDNEGEISFLAFFNEKEHKYEDVTFRLNVVSDIPQHSVNFNNYQVTMSSNSIQCYYDDMSEMENSDRWLPTVSLASKTLNVGKPEDFNFNNNVLAYSGVKSSLENLTLNYPVIDENLIVDGFKQCQGSIALRFGVSI